VVVCVLDVSAAVNLLVDSELSLQVNICNIRVNLSLNAIVGVALPGLNRCLDNLLQILDLPHIYISAGSLDITGCAVVGGNTLSVSVLLDASISIGSAVNVDLNVVLYSSAGVLQNLLLPCNFIGLPGEVVIVTVDLIGLNLNGSVFVYLELADLDVALNVNLDLGGCQLFQLLNGILTPCIGAGSCH
jgi:hypothetical protein